MTAPVVDVVIAVHTVQRPIERAVGSVLGGTTAPVRVSVICHGVPVDDIAARLGPLATDHRVRLEHLDDGIPSPAGPFNRGLDLASARFATILGSDDEFEPHAVDSWLASADRTDAKAVICAQTFASGLKAKTPLTRPLRRRRLDPVRDRLAYRTAPLGLLDTRTIADVRLTTGLTTGEDIAFALRVWFSGAGIDFDSRGPGYLVHDEGDAGRVTTVVRSIDDEFAFLPHIVEADWFLALAERARRSIATKLLRNHVLPAALLRVRAGALSPDEQFALAAVADRVRSSASAPDAVLARREARVLDLLGAEPEALRRGVEGYEPLLSAQGILPASGTRLLDRDAPPRLLAAAAFAGI